jgi:type IV fimbrial biogenesis protein FimT
VLILRRQRGFNLVEIIVTIAVLAMLLGATIPSMSDWIRATQVRTIAESTQAGLQKARSEAMKRNKVVTFWMVSPNGGGTLDNTCALNATAPAWVVSIDNPATKCATAPSSTAEPRIVESYGPGTAGANVVVSAVDATPAAASSVSFSGFGQRVGAGLSKVDISHSAGATIRALRIEVSSSGGIRMCDPQAVSPDPRACNLP